MQTIYLDYNATTPLDPEVLEAMLPYLRERHGNASSGHWAGRLARAGIDRAREQVASLLGCDTAEVVFTGGASEANNLCLKGMAWARREGPRNLVTSVVEHGSVAKSCQFLQSYEGWDAGWVPVDGFGMVDRDIFRSLLRPETSLVSIMLAQNEVGTLQPIAELVRTVREHAPQALFHTDASQAGGKIPFKVHDLGVDLCVIAAHKFYGPKGTAAAFIRQGLAPVSLVHGVAHEAGRRAGTENVAGIVGMGKACELAQSRMAATVQHQRRLRERLWEELRRVAPSAIRQGHPTEVLPNTLNVCLPGVDSTALLQRVGDRLAASNGAACHWGVTEPSVVLTAMGVPRDVALGAMRLSLGKDTTEAEVDEAVGIIAGALVPTALQP